MMTPLISIIIPVFNRSEYAPLLCKSLVNQSEKNWEAIFVDDGSNSDEASCWQEHLKSDKRFTLITRNRDPKGAPTCRNMGFEKSSGKYVIFLDCDDALDSIHCLEQRQAALEKFLEYDYTVSPTEVFSLKPGDLKLLWNQPGTETDLDRFLRRDIPWQTTGPTWRREALEKIGPWDETLPGRQDWEYHIRAISLGLKYRRVNGGKSFWRKTTEGSLSGVNLSSDQSLSATLVVLGKIQQLLQENSLLTTRRQHLLGMQHLALAMTSFRSGNNKLADKSIRCGVQREVLPEKLEQPLRIYAYSSRIPLASKVVQTILSPFIDHDYFIPWWTNQLRVPISEIDQFDKFE